MAHTLLAILLVTDSAQESKLVYQWPKDPKVQPRLSRPRPDCTQSPAHWDNVWKASNYGETDKEFPHEPLDDPEYEWQRTSPRSRRNTSSSASNPNISPSKRSPETQHDHDSIFGYSSSFLAKFLCPQRYMCHQRCELLVDDLTFIGHPVCADQDGEWLFRPERQKSGTRGRENRSGLGSETVAEESPDRQSLQLSSSSKASWLTTFNLVLVLDHPDPSSSASGNFLKYLDVIYKQVAFSVMAVLYQQQVSSNYVEKECEILGSLRDTCMSKGHDFSAQALEASSLALAVKNLYEAIKTSTMAYISIDNIPLELQLPPFLDQLLHSEDSEFVYQPINDDDDAYYKQAWGEDLSEVGWNLPSLDPWKSLLMLDSSFNLETPYIESEDRNLVEGLVKFMDIARVTLSLADMASLLDWDYDTQIVPTVRWLVQHRRAKVVDIVQHGLKTVFTLPPTFSSSIQELAEEFNQDFGEHPQVSSLPVILSSISTSPSQNHFFATVVQDKDLLPLYHEVVVWMLKREMLVTLHLRVRVVATKELKLRVMAKDARERAKKAAVAGRGRSKLHREIDEDSPPAAFVSLSPKAARAHSRMKDPVGEFESLEDEDENVDQDDSGWETYDDETRSSMIPDPGRASARQTRWLLGMSEGKEPHIVNRFNQIFQYFDGKHTDDEILFKAEIPRKVLRQILHHYDEYLQTFLHP